MADPPGLLSGNKKKRKNEEEIDEIKESLL